MPHMDTTSLLFVGSASTQPCFLLLQNNMPFGSIKSLSWVDTVCLVLSFPGRERSLHIASGSHRVPLLAAEPVLKKQMYSWSHSFGNKASVAYLKESQVWSWEHRAQLHGFGN